MQPKEATRIPRRFVFFDSESHTDIKITEDEINQVLAAKKGNPLHGVKKFHDCYLVCASFIKRPEGGKVHGFKERYYEHHQGTIFIKEFWQHVDEFVTPREEVWLFAHNAKYDFQVMQMVPHLVDMGYTVTQFSDANPFIMELTKKVGERKNGKPINKKIVVLSSTNYFQTSLASLGEKFGLPKLDFDHGTKVDMSNPEMRAMALTYCDRDVEILETAVLSFIDFIDRENLGSLAKTVAGQALNAYMNRFMPADTIHIHNNKKALDVERRAYAGGRTECFSYGEVEGTVYVNDVNSMYPSVMLKHAYPTKLRTFWEFAEPSQVQGAIMDDFLICCDVRLKTPLPIFHVKNERLIFPVGDFWTTLSTPELIKAFELDLIVEVKNVAIYEQGHIFAEYVNYYYTARLKAKEEKDAINDYLYKLFLNTLYGKFGQKNIHWDAIAEADPYEVSVDTIYNPITREVRYTKTFGGNTFEKYENEDDLESMHSFPAIAAHVTAYARMLLWECIEVADLSNVHYCDTDSLFTNLEGYVRLQTAGLIDEKRLGALAMEKEGSLHLYGCKDYVFDGKAKIKGVNLKNAVPMEPDEFGRVRFAVTQWGGLTDRLRDKDMMQFYNKVIIKTLSREYNKGIVDGSRVRPYLLDYGKEQEQITKDEIMQYRKELAAGVDDLFVTDPIFYLCKGYGHIKVVEKGERFYKEYTSLPQAVRIKYFRLRGIPLDVWANDNGMSARELFDYLNQQ